MSRSDIELLIFMASFQHTMSSNTNNVNEQYTQFYLILNSTVATWFYSNSRSGIILCIAIMCFS